MAGIRERHSVCPNNDDTPWWLFSKKMQSIEIIAEWRFLVMQELLGLTAEQREQILAHRHIKLVSLARLVQERRELQVKLQVRDPCLSEQRLNQGSMLCGSVALWLCGSAAVTARDAAQCTLACLFPLISRSLMTYVVL